MLAHEYGHHVQNLIGRRWARRSRRPGRAERLGAHRAAGRLLRRGVGAQRGRDRATSAELTDADIADGLDAAAAVGDDRIQERATGRVDPESWTHGSSAQRQRWFTTGYESGDPASCDTFRGSI